MSRKITYLLGAGASANALPLIKSGKDKAKQGLPGELKSFLESGKSAILHFNTWKEKDYLQLIEISDKCIECGTPDLYAKSLWESGDNVKYILLKRLISNYFVFKQTLAQPATSSTQGCFDQRAFSFLSAITQNQRLSDNIKILSWNYDEQIEMAAVKLRPVNSKVFNMLKGFTTWPNYKESYDYDVRHDYRNDDIFLLHLNGVAGYEYSARDLSEKNNLPFGYKSGDQTQLLSFAWETDPDIGLRIFIEGRIKKAVEMATGTQILVVVGYSFPFFNKNIDSVLLNAMAASLEKIYYQDPILDGNHLIGQFDLLPNIANLTRHIHQTDNYHLPGEL